MDIYKLRLASISSVKPNFSTSHNLFFLGCWICWSTRTTRSKWTFRTSRTSWTAWCSRYGTVILCISVLQSLCKSFLLVFMVYGCFRMLNFVEMCLLAVVAYVLCIIYCVYVYMYTGIILWRFLFLLYVQNISTSTKYD